MATARAARERRIPIDAGAGRRGGRAPYGDYTEGRLYGALREGLPSLLAADAGGHGAGGRPPSKYGRD